MQGIAKGSGLSMNDVIAAQFIEIVSGNPKSTFANLPIQACSQLFALSDATADGSIFFARNYDFPNFLQPMQVVREEKPSEGYRTLMLSQYVMAGAHIGLNEKGLALGNQLWKNLEESPFRLSAHRFPSPINITRMLGNL